MIISFARRSGETGRRAGLKIRWGLPPVWVRFPPPAPISQSLTRFRSSRLWRDRASVCPECARELLKPIAKVRFVDDAIAVKDATCLVSGNLHPHLLGHVRSHRFRTAVRRKSCGMRPGQPAALQAASHAPRKSRICLPFRWNTHGTMTSLARSTAFVACRCSSSSVEMSARTSPLRQ